MGAVFHKSMADGAAGGERLFWGDEARGGGSSCE